MGRILHRAGLTQPGAALFYHYRCTLYNNTIHCAMIQSVERALHLLTLIATEREPLGVRDVARRSGLTVPTAQNLLKTLAASGFLHFDERERKYRVGVAALLLADAADPVACIRSFAHPFVERLQAETRTTVVLVTFWQGKIMVADWCEPERGLPCAPADGCSTIPSTWPRVGC